MRSNPFKPTSHCIDGVEAHSAVAYMSLQLYETPVERYSTLLEVKAESVAKNLT
jgi:hypothetical protein